MQYILGLASILARQRRLRRSMMCGGTHDSVYRNLETEAGFNLIQENGSYILLEQ